MKKFLLLSCFCLIVSSCVDKETKEESEAVSFESKNTETTLNADYKLDIYDFNGFESYLNKKDDKIYVVNFWATWCAPCIKELPYFEEVNKTYKSKNVEVLLVSLDFPKAYDKKLIPFIIERELQSKVIALNDTKMNDWIPKVDADWSGSIPATIIYNKDKSQFYEQSFSLEELEAELEKFITP